MPNCKTCGHDYESELPSEGCEPALPDEELDLATPGERALIDEMFAKKEAKAAARQAEAELSAEEVERARQAGPGQTIRERYKRPQAEQEPPSHQTMGFSDKHRTLNELQVLLRKLFNEVGELAGTQTKTGAIESLIRHLAIDLLDSEEFKAAVIAQATQLVSAAFPAFLKTQLFKDALLMYGQPAIANTDQFTNSVLTILDDLGLITRNAPRQSPKMQPEDVKEEIIEIDEQGNVRPLGHDPEQVSNYFHTLAAKIDRVNERVNSILELDQMFGKGINDKVNNLHKALMADGQQIRDGINSFSETTHKNLITLEGITRGNCVAIHELNNATIALNKTVDENQAQQDKDNMALHEKINTITRHTTSNGQALEKLTNATTDVKAEIEAKFKEYCDRKNQPITADIKIPDAKPGN